MTVEVAALVEALDAAVIDHGQSLDAVGDMLTQRAAIIEQIVALDPADLSAESKAALTGALERARLRDTNLVAALLRERDRTAEALDVLVDARRGARGYRGGPKPTRGAVLKSA